MHFRLVGRDSGSHARAGVIETGHGIINTPIFMPVGTAATVKGLHNKDLQEQVKAQIILANTYHIYLRPGIDIIRNAGGIHKFNGWDKPILTDSGGYQVYSLAHRRKLKENGVVFQSHIDGSKHTFTPESVIDIQRIIGADIIMAFDECTPYPCSYEYASESLKITHGWLDRCCIRFDNSEELYGNPQTLFPIVQGSVYKDLREQSATYIASLGRDGNAIGGLSVGEPAEVLYEMTEHVCNILPADKPRYLMGVGTPANILEAIALGVDMFDCVMPTRNARNGMIFTSEGILNMRNEKWKNDFSQVDPNGMAFVDSMYSKAYLRHLFICNEMLASIIATMHNLTFYLQLVTQAHSRILEGDFANWKKTMVDRVSRRL